MRRKRKKNHTLIYFSEEVRSCFMQETKEKEGDLNTILKETGRRIIHWAGRWQSDEKKIVLASFNYYRHQYFESENVRLFGREGHL